MIGVDNLGYELVKLSVNLLMVKTDYTEFIIIVNQERYTLYEKEIKEYYDSGNVFNDMYLYIKNVFLQKMIIKIL